MMAVAGIVCEPPSALVDVVLHISVGGAAPSAPLTLVARTAESNSRFYSYAHYVTDDHGSVHIDRDASQGGNYTGVRPMGLFTHMQQEPGQRPGRRLVKADIESPVTTHLFALSGHVYPDGDHLDGLDIDSQQTEDSGKKINVSKTGRKHLAHVEIQRWYKATGVKRVPLNHHRLKGVIFIPEGIGPFPGVLDLFGTIGGVVEHRSALLASRGCVSLALGYFSPGKDEGLVCDLEYFEMAIDLVLAHPGVSPGGVGVVGVSKGAELAIMLATYIPDKVKLCAEINGMCFPTLVNHTYKGETISLVELDITAMIEREDGMVFQDTYLNVQNLDSHTFHVEKAKCHFMLIHGADDLSNPATITTELLPARLHAHGRNNYTVLLYPDTGHLIEPPYSPHFYSTYHAMFSSMAIWGGKPDSHAYAQEDIWRQLLLFIHRYVMIPTTPQHHL